MKPRLTLANKAYRIGDHDQSYEPLLVLVDGDTADLILLARGLDPTRVRYMREMVRRRIITDWVPYHEQPIPQEAREASGELR